MSDDPNRVPSLPSMHKIGAVEFTTIDGGRCTLSVRDITSWGENNGSVQVYVRHEAEPWDVQESYEQVTSQITTAMMMHFGAAQN